MQDRPDIDMALSEAMCSMRRRIEETFLIPPNFFTNTVAAASSNTLTVHAVEAAMRSLPNLMPPRLRMKIIYSDHALETTKERLFPESKHRSARIRKKLIKRFGGEYRQKPAMWLFDDALIAHPSFRPRLESAFSLFSPSDQTRIPVIAGTPYPCW